MKKALILSVLFCSSLSFAAPLVGYSTLEPENRYRILNAAKKEIFSATADTVKRVELRDGHAVVQTRFNNVSLIREDGTVLVDAVFGSDFKISKTMLAINGGGNAAVYGLDGKKIYSTNRPVGNILIANDRFAVMDQYMEQWTVYALDGSELLTNRQLSRVLLSDGFLATVSTLGTLSLYDANLDLITTDSGMSQLQISDEFAGYVDNWGYLRLFSRSAGEFPMLPNVTNYTMTNTFVAVNDSFGLTLYGTDKLPLEINTPGSIKSYATSHENFAYIGNTGALWVKNEATGESFVVNQAQSYLMSDDLLLVKNWPGNIMVYSLKSGFFGNVVYSKQDQTILVEHVGNGVISLQTSLGNASMTAKVVAFPLVGDRIGETVLVDDWRIGRIDLSVNREELNWK